MHREMLEHLERQLAHEEHLLHEIEELADRRPQLRLERLDRQLRGRRLQEVAVEVLRRRIGHDQAVHYREWFSLLRAEGYEIPGRDPVNSFLTGIGRASNVERVGSREWALPCRRLDGDWRASDCRSDPPSRLPALRRLATDAWSALICPSR